MKTLITMFMMVALITLTGCWNTTSNKGGIAPTHEQFSISVPSPMTIKQGITETITISIKRDVDFKQDVQLELKANGISVMPTNILVKSGDKPDVKIQITASSDAAIGNYIVSVKGTPEKGQPTSAGCLVTIIAQ